MSLAKTRMAQAAKDKRCGRTRLSLQEENDLMRTCLETIRDWKLPKTGSFTESGRERSYGECWGSQGERQFIQFIAGMGLSNV